MEEPSTYVLQFLKIPIIMSLLIKFQGLDQTHTQRKRSSIPFVHLGLNNFALQNK